MMETVRDVVTVMVYVAVIGLVSCLVSAGLVGCTSVSSVAWVF